MGGDEGTVRRTFNVSASEIGYRPCFVQNCLHLFLYKIRFRMTSKDWLDFHSGLV